MRWINRRAALFSILSIALITGLATRPAQAEEEDPKKKGWEIYQKARERAGAVDAEPIRDYTLDLVTKVNNPQRKGPLELASRIFFLAPTLVRQEIQTPNATVVVVFDGSKGWQMLPNDTRYLSESASEQIAADLARSHVLLFDQPEKEDVRFLRREEVEGTTTDVIEINDVADMPLRLFVDVDTHDVIKKMFVGDTPTGMAQVEEFFSDFRVVDGYRWPFHRKVLRNGKFALEADTKKMEINVGLDESDFLER